ncbi:transglutaminase [Leptolyngbya sp. 'hensonii']|uniref:transglutaminase TgpA family protein n=1 Tax=Leptolyngbya sp. 'hensonii' TaxID=1922337 RepID=UPI0009500FE9|nr:transglutaminaseTgpA domain-containing protein [Leptolyngbya sp. 'hensonii']OLP18764.1 transglutaminase [Leptolyngbya sp. 'hensonii']
MSNASGTQQQPSNTGFRGWRPWENLPLPEPEDSVLLRVLTQALVIVGIIATDVAAGGIGGWQITSYWSVPFSIVGASWSWYRRRKRNIATKFMLAIGMLLTLAAFFSRLFGELNDPRLALAQLLIQLQVLHSFDLPRRKDLGYSMVIGLILIGVAGTLSETLAFGPMLLLFITIALPVLVLDYRSRLGLVLRGLKIPTADLSPRRLGVFWVAIVGLGLVVFTLMPRFPGYQLRTFPVSPPANLQQQRTDLSRITNPGYPSRGGNEPGTGQGQGDPQAGQGTGQGTLNPDHYYGFNNQINQNLRGELKPKVVMRVRSQAEGFWRVMAFDRYTGQGWEVSRSDRSSPIRRPSWTYQFFLPIMNLTGRTREVVQTYTIVSEEFPNIIPALYQPKELYFFTDEIGVDAEGGLRSPLAVTEGATYTVISEVPFRNRTVLGKAPKVYPVNIRKYYLQLPPTIAPRVQQRTEEILATAPNILKDPYEKALYLAQYLKQNYQILPELPFWGFNEDMVESFLFLYKGGYPDHFSTALTVMLRSVGIPARLTTGFLPGQFNPFTGLYIVKNTDAFAMTEVYFPKQGWFAFDPIPGHELYPPSVEESQTFTVLQKFWQWVAGWLPSPVTSFLNRFFSIIFGPIVAIVAWFISLITQGWFGLFAALLIGVGLAFLLWLAWNAWRAWRYQLWLARLPAMESLYRQMLDWLGDRGLRRQPTQTPFEYAQQVRTQQPPEASAIIDEISDAYVRWRYGAQAVDTQHLQQQFLNLRQRSSAASRFRRRSPRNS